MTAQIGSVLPSGLSFADELFFRAGWRDFGAVKIQDVVHIREEELHLFEIFARRASLDGSGVKNCKACMEKFPRQLELRLSDFEEDSLSAFLFSFRRFDEDCRVIKPREFVALSKDAAQLGIVHKKSKRKGEIETELRITKRQTSGLEVLNHDRANRDRFMVGHADLLHDGLQTLVDSADDVTLSLDARYCDSSVVEDAARELLA